MIHRQIVSTWCTSFGGIRNLNENCIKHNHNQVEKNLQLNLEVSMNLGDLISLTLHHPLGIKKMLVYIYQKPANKILLKMTTH